MTINKKRLAEYLDITQLDSFSRSEHEKAINLLDSMAQTADESVHSQKMKKKKGGDVSKKTLKVKGRSQPSVAIGEMPDPLSGIPIKDKKKT